MKKLFLLLLTLFLPLSVNAEEFKFNDINIDFDKTWYVFTKDNIKNNKDLELLEIPEETMYEFFDASIYQLDAIKFLDDDVAEMFLAIKDIDTDLSTSIMSDSDLEQLKDMYAKGMNIFKKDIFKTSYNTYIKSYYEDQGLYIIDYYATYKGHGYTIKFQKKHEFKDEEITYLDNMVKNVYFGEKKKEVKKSLDEEGLAYSIGYFAGMGACIGAIIGVIVYLTKKKKNS